MKKTITRILAFVAALVCGGAWAATPLVYNQYLTSEYADTGWTVASADDLASRSFAGIMAGANVNSGNPLPSMGYYVTKQSDDTVTFEMQVKNNQLKAILVRMKVENGTVWIKGDMAGYRASNNLIGTRCFSADGTSRADGTNPANIGTSQSASDSYACGAVDEVLSWSNASYVGQTGYSVNQGAYGPYRLRIPATADLPLGSILRIKEISIARRDGSTDQKSVISVGPANDANVASDANSVDTTDRLGGKTRIRYPFSKNVMVQVGTEYPSYLLNQAGGGATDNTMNIHVITPIDEGADVLKQTNNSPNYCAIYEVKAEVVFTPDTSRDADVSFVTPNAPTKALKATVKADNTAFGVNQAYTRVVNGRFAQVVNVTGSSAGETAMIFGGTAKNAEGAVDADIWMNVSGGTFGSIFGGSNCDNYQGARQSTIKGNVVLEVGGSTTANNVLGGFYKDGHGPTLNGNIDVVIKDHAVVKGVIAGAGMSAHNNNAAYTGNVKVTVKNVQSDNTAGALISADSSDYIVGGGVYGTNANSKENITGNTAVVIDLPDDATGSFVKNIVGGGFIPTGGASRGTPECKVSGNTSVSILAPAGVTFSGDIYAGGYLAGTSSGNVSVGGTASVTLNGGTYTGSIKAGTATGAKTLAITGAVTLAPSQIFGFDTIVAREGGALTLNIGSDVAMSNIATEGKGYIVKTGSGTLDVGSLRPRMDIQAGKIKLLASSENIADGYIILPIPTTASEGDADKVLVVDANGETIQLNGTPQVDTTAGTVRINLQVNTVINTTGILSDSIQDSSSGLFLIQGPATGTPIEITIDRATPVDVTYQVSGLVKFILADGQTLVSLEKFAFDEGSELILDASCAGSITVPAGKSITIGGGTYTIVNNGTVRVKDDTSVTLTNNASGIFDVVSGNATVAVPQNQAIKGTIYVRSGATYTNNWTSDAIDYNGTVNAHVYGTLAFGSTRWTFGANNNLYLYTGATVTGTGEGGNGTLDFNGGNGNIYVKPNGSTTGTVTCSAPMRNRQGGTITVDQDMVFETTGNLINYENGSPTKSGAGTWVVKGSTYSSGATVNAGTLKLEGINPGNTITMAGGTLELAQNANGEAFTFTGTVASSALGNGTIKTAGSTVTLSGTFTSYSGDIDSSADNSRFIIPEGQEVTVGWIVPSSAIEIEGMLVHTNKSTSTDTNYQGQNLRNLTGNGTFKITGPRYFFTCGTSSLENYWASTLAICNERGDSTAGNDKGIVWGQPPNGNKTISIGPLSGHGMMRTDAKDGNRNLKVTQTADSEWSGVFCGNDRLGTFIVAGAEGATAKTLTLSGTQTATNDLTIEETGSVKLTGTWLAETTTVNGRLEVMKTATLTTPTLNYATKIETTDSVIYYGSDALAAVDAEVKVTGGEKDVYYATVADAVAAGGTLATMTLIKTPTSTLPDGYALVTPTGAGVASLRQAGEIYWKGGDWKADTTYYATSDKNSTTTYLTGDTIVFDTDTTVYYMQSWDEVVHAKIAENTTVIFGHNDWNGSTTRNIMSGSTITVEAGARALFGFWDNTNNGGVPKIVDLTINGEGTWGQANNLVDGNRMNPGSLTISGNVTGTAKLVINEGDEVKVLSSGSVANPIVSGAVGMEVKVTTDASSNKTYSLDLVIKPNVDETDQTVLVVAAVGAVITKDGTETPLPGTTIPLDTTALYHITAGSVSKDVGVIVAKTAEAGTTRVTTLVAVPFANLDSKALTIDSLLVKSNLSDGDEIMAWNAFTKKYDAWSWSMSEGSWGPSTTVTKYSVAASVAASNYNLYPGQAVWVRTAGKVVVYGMPASDESKVTASTGVNLLGNTAMVPATPEDLLEVKKDDIVEIPGVETKVDYNGKAYPVRLFKRTKTGWVGDITVEDEGNTLEGLNIKTTIPIEFTTGPSVPAGRGYFLKRPATAQSTPEP